MLLVCAIVLTRHPAAQPGCLKRPRRKPRTFPHLNLAAARRLWPEGRRISRLSAGDLPVKTGRPGNWSWPRPCYIKECRMLRRSSNALPVAALRPASALAISPALAEPTPKDVLEDLCRHRRKPAMRTRLDTARTLKLAVDALLAKPTEDNLRCRPRRLDRRAHPLHADRGLPLRQLDRRRLGGQGELLAARRGADRLCRRRPMAPSPPRTSSIVANVIANTDAHHRRQEARHREDHQGASRRQAARGRRRRGQCRDRLSRHRVPALGPGPERHRSRQRQSPRHRLRHQEMHQRQLRAPRPISPHRHRPSRRRSRLDGGPMGPRRRGAQEA